ncbi:MAG: esterase-like activity of phytase family protein [Pseudomonadota bacterium]
MRSNLVAVAICLCACGAEAQDIGRIDISAEAVLGVSGIEVSADGSTFLAVSDAGWFLEGTLERNDSTLVGGEVTAVLPILGQDGRPVAARRVGDWSDAEGIAIGADGQLYVSFERWMRVVPYDDTTAIAGWIKDHPEFLSYPENRQMESVAIDPESRVIALPESEGPAGGFPIYRLDDDGWQVATFIEASNAYSIVGADFSDDGRLFILERKLVLFTWWQNRIREVDPETGAAKVIWEPGSNDYGNLEGISIWRAPDGLRAVMIADNNGRENIPTEIVEIRLTD